MQKGNYILFFLPRECSRRAEECESPTWKTHRDSGLTSRNSTRFIGSMQTSHAHLRASAPARFCTRSLKLHRRTRAGSMTQKPNSSHSLAPLGYPSDPKNTTEKPFLLPGASCPRPVLDPFPRSPPLIHFLLGPAVHRSSATQKGPAVPGNKRRVKEKREVFACLSIRRPRFCAHLVNDDPLLYLAEIASVPLTRRDENSKRDCRSRTYTAEDFKSLESSRRGVFSGYCLTSIHHFV